MIKNGRPYTIESDGHTVDSKLITDRTHEEFAKVCDWIMANIVPTHSELKEKTSYSIKHILEKDLGLYLSNNEFKDAMLICGFSPIDSEKLNWTYRISKFSPAFKEQAREKYRMDVKADENLTREREQSYLKGYEDAMKSPNVIRVDALKEFLFQQLLANKESYEWQNGVEWTISQINHFINLKQELLKETKEQ